MKSNERTPRNPGNIKVSTKAGQDPPSRSFLPSHVSRVTRDVDRL